MGVFRFSKKAPLRHGEDGGGVAVIEPAPSQQSAPQPHSNAAAPHGDNPFVAALEQLDREDRALATLEQERLRLIAGRDSALAGVTQQRRLLAGFEDPIRLAAITDLELDQHAARLRQLLRELGLAERALESFNAAHPDVPGERAAWNERREKLERSREKWLLEQEWFSTVSPQLEQALLLLCDWTQRRFVLSRELGITTTCGIDFDNFPSGPLSRDVVTRSFGFQRAYCGRSSEAGFERLLQNAREHNVWPARPAITWR